jgi:mRNA-degrading endonuclease toxin of MazEF toxin-antitoxin module
VLGIGNTGCIFRRGDSIFRDDDRLIATEEAGFRLCVWFSPARIEKTISASLVVHE